MEIINKKNKSTIQYKIISIVFTLMCMLYIISGIFQFSNEVKVKQGILLVIFILVFILSVKKFKQNYIVPLFLISLFIFQWGRIVLLYFVFDLKPKMTWFLYQELSIETLKSMYNLLFYNIVGIFLGIYFYKKNKNIKFKESIKRSKKLLLLIVFLTFPFLLKVSLGIILEGIKLGYLNTYLISTKDLNSSNNIFKILSNISYYGIFIGLALNPRKDIKTKMIIYLYIVVLFLEALKGQRGPFVSGIFFLIWYVSYYKIYRISFLKKIMLLFFLVLLSQGLDSFRNKSKNSETKLERITRFIHSQGVTGTLLFMVNDKKEFFEGKKIPFLISSLSGEKIEFQSQEIANKVKKSSNVALAHKMSVELNENMYISGMGVGGNYILEMYDLAKQFGVLLLSMIHIVFLIWISENLNRFNLFFKSYIFTLMPKIFMIPRSEYLIYFSFEGILKLVIVYLVIKLLEIFIKNIIELNVN